MCVETGCRKADVGDAGSLVAVCQRPNPNLSRAA